MTLRVQRYEKESLSDDFDNYNWTLTGRVSDLQLLYTGAYTDRKTDQTVDYTDYLFVGQYLPYYICDCVRHLSRGQRACGNVSGARYFCQ